MTLRVLDKNGRELSKGAQVERIVNGVRGGIVGRVVAATKLDVMVEWPGPHWVFYKPTRDSLLKRTYRANDLELTEPPQQREAASAAPESERRQ